MAHAAGLHTALGKALNLPIALLTHLGAMLTYPTGGFWGISSFLIKHIRILGLEKLLCVLRWLQGVSVSLGWLGIGAMGTLLSSCWSPSLHVKVQPSSPGCSQ